MEGELFQIIREMTEMTGKNCQISKRGGWNIFMKSINVEGEIFQIIREMTEMTCKNCQITKNFEVGI